MLTHCEIEMTVSCNWTLINFELLETVTNQFLFNFIRTLESDFSDFLSARFVFETRMRHRTGPETAAFWAQTSAVIHQLLHCDSPLI